MSVKGTWAIVPIILIYLLISTDHVGGAKGGNAADRHEVADNDFMMFSTENLPKNTNFDANDYSEAWGGCTDSESSISPGAFNSCGDAGDQEFAGIETTGSVDPDRDATSDNADNSRMTDEKQ